MLHAILVKFPKREVDAHAQFIYLGLVVCLANEADTKVASMVSMVIKVLINRVGQFALNQIIEFSFSWYKGEKEIFWGASAQVFFLCTFFLFFIWSNHICLNYTKLNKIINLG